jgi:hypothetical protein
MASTHSNFVQGQADKVLFNCPISYGKLCCKVTRRLEKNSPNLQKIARKVSKSIKGKTSTTKCPKYLHQTTIETLKTNNLCFKTAYLGENVKKICLNKK